MNQTLDMNLLDYADYPTLKCAVIPKEASERAVPVLSVPEIQQGDTVRLCSIQEPYYPWFSWIPFLVFLAVFAPLFLCVVVNGDGLVYALASVLGRAMRVQ